MRKLFVIAHIFYSVSVYFSVLQHAEVELSSLNDIAMY